MLNEGWKYKWIFFEKYVSRANSFITNLTLCALWENTDFHSEGEIKDHYRIVNKNAYFHKVMYLDNAIIWVAFV
jgi:hypothetical protein